MPAPPLERRDRSRGFVGGFTAADLAWEAWASGALASGLEQKVLSFDSTTGDTTRLVRAPGPLEAELAAADGYLDVLVLSGSVALAGAELRDLCYVGIPGDGLGGTLRTESGFEALVITSQDEGAPVEPIDLRVAPWRNEVEQLPSPLPPGLLAKPLRANSRGGLLFCSGSLLRWMRDGRWEAHPAFEEQFYLAGEFTQKERLREGTVTLVYGPGGYSFRPPGIWHLGPGSGTDSFCIRLVRTPERLVNEYRAEPGEYPARYAW